jgi:hypothetical protein
MGLEHWRSERVAAGAALARVRVRVRARRLERENCILDGIGWDEVV